MTKMLQCALVASLFALTGCNNKAEVVSAWRSDSMPTTLKANEKLAQELNLDDQQDFEDAKRGLIARPEGKILATTAASADRLRRLQVRRGQGAANRQPQPVAPRHAQCPDRPVQGDRRHLPVARLRHGEHDADRRQDRLDRGGRVDRRESAAAALAFARKHLGDKPVSAMVFTHSHIDHFGGALGVASGQGSRPSARCRSSPLMASWKKPPART